MGGRLGTGWVILSLLVEGKTTGLSYAKGSTSVRYAFGTEFKSRGNLHHVHQGVGYRVFQFELHIWCSGSLNK